MGIKPPLFSVIINNYNYGPYIEEAIKSVLNQTFLQDDIEIIVVDDGSTDDSAGRIKKYEGRVICLRKENGGQASALNLGIEHAGGKIIAFLDSDDYWHPMKLQYIYEEFKNNDRIDFVFHYMNVIDSGYKIIDRYIYPEPVPGGKTAPGERYLDRYLKGIIPWFSPTSGMAVKADCLRKACPIPEDFRIGADIYLHYILPLYSRELSLVRKPLGNYRLHNSNLSGGNLLSIEKLRRESSILRIIESHVERHVRNLGYDSRFLVKRLESCIAWYEILTDILTKEKGRAIRKIIRFDKFLPCDTFFYKLFRKITMLIYAVFSPSDCLWLQRKYRKVSYVLYRLGQRIGVN